MASARDPPASARIVASQNSEDETWPCTNSTGGPVRPVASSTAEVRRSVGTRRAVIPGSSVSIGLLHESGVSPGHRNDVDAQSGFGLTVVGVLTTLAACRK